MDTITTKLNKCWLVFADDYHEFTYAQNLYKSLGINTSFQELDFLYGHEYVAVFWIGKQTKVVYKFIEQTNRDLSVIEEEVYE